MRRFGPLIGVNPEAFEESPIPTRGEGEWWANMAEVFHTD